MRLRSLTELAAAEVSEFRPALDLLRPAGEERGTPAHGFFAPEQPVYIARAPGRLDVMGGIADYSGALVLQLPLDRATWALAQRQREARIEIASRREGRWHEFAIGLSDLEGALAAPKKLASWFAQRPDTHWAAYIIGTIHFCLHPAPPDLRPSSGGLRLLIDSSVPEGRGISSSAALEVASMAATAAAYGIDMRAPDLAAACQWVENHVVGAPCGIMDQMTSARGECDRLLRLRCQPAVIEGYADVPRGYRFYGIDSGVRHAVSGADYGTVRTAAFMGYRIITDRIGLPAERSRAGIRVRDERWSGYLTNIDPGEFARDFESLLPERMCGKDFLDRYQGITDTATRVLPERWYPVRQATAHPVHEQQRVDRFARLLSLLPDQPRLAMELGQLMYASHDSYGACGLGSDATDRLVQLVRQAGVERGLFGAKITGGGSGGTVAVFGTAEAEPLVHAIAGRYREETGREAAVFARSGPGAAATGVLVVDPTMVSHLNG